MPSLMNKNQLSDSAKTLAQSFSLIQRGATTFIPVHWEDGSIDPPPQDGERIWVPFTREDKLRLSNIKSGILFANDAEFRSYDFMLRQVAEQHSQPVSSILIKTPEGLRMLDRHGKLVPHDGKFTPNYIQPMLNDDTQLKMEIYAIIVDWLGGSTEQADSLLAHLATSLAPHYSAVKYVLLLGEGRNGKSVMLSMLTELYGKENVSHITRQMMAERSPTCVELNDKLVNVIFDGEMGYIKDSSMEKTLIAGETGIVRMLYESGTTPVQTNALFLEALNQEPKARDKSPALQKRLVRFQFPNTYAVDKEFSKRMVSEKYLGAFLALLIDHYVPEEEIAERLTLTRGSMELQFEQMFLGSPILQYLEHLQSTDPKTLERLTTTDMPIETFIHSFQPWCETEGFPDRSTSDIAMLMKSVFDISWKTVREDGKPRNRKRIRGIKPEAKLALTQMLEEGGDDVEDQQTELVGD